MLKDLPELVESGVISQEIADRIEAYYRREGKSSPNRLFIVFGILGALLVGLGIILIVAHNWDNLSPAIKTAFAFLPLVVGQLLCGYVLLKKRESVAWRESATSFLFFAVGASISLISQIYNIPGNMSSFLLTWMLACLPMVYVMRSSMASLLYLAGITWYGAETCYWSYYPSESYLFWILLLGVLPHYYLLYRDQPKSNFMTFHNWLIPLAVIAMLGTLARDLEEFMFAAYVSLFGLLTLIGGLEGIRRSGSRINSYAVLGSLGTVIILLTLSFDWLWEELRRESYHLSEVVVSPEFIATALLSVVAGILLFRRRAKRSFMDINPMDAAFLVFLVIFLIGFNSSIAVVLINLLILGIGILTMRKGARQDHLGLLNYGLLIISALVLCRFFDTDLSFVIRGVIFISVGVGFFAANYWMLRKRKAHV